MNKKRLILCYLFLSTFWAEPYLNPCFADSAKEKYYIAENCYRQLKEDIDGQKFRDNWLVCIKSYMDVYRFEPDGPWAAAGLYSAGKLFSELYQKSQKASDKKNAIDTFKKVIKNYATSRYYDLADKDLNRLTSAKKGSLKYTTASDRVQEAYESAKTCMVKLQKSPGKQKHRYRWMGCIQQFDTIYLENSAHKLAPASLFMKAKLYSELFPISEEASDKEMAKITLEDVIRLYPATVYKLEAEKLLGKLSFKSSPIASKGKKDEIADLIKTMKSGDKKKKKSFLAKAFKGKNKSLVNGLRYWSNPNYTRVVVDADKETTFSYRFLKEELLENKPERLFIDMDNAHLDKGLDRKIPINDKFLIDAWADQYRPSKVRVVIDMKKFENYKIFPLKNPFRIVVDVWGESKKMTASKSTPHIKKDISKKNLPLGALTRQLALGVGKIVIDPGHGGRDYGAPGALSGVHEKYVVLKIAKKLSKKLSKKLKCQVMLTREGDEYLSLEERTAFANTMNADLFISIHTNAANNKEAHGIETYYLNRATDDEAIMVAARENATTKKNVSDLQSILDDLMQNVKINESSRLALYVHQSLISHMTGKYKMIVNKGVKQAPFYVLLGAQMPAILIETSFISNAMECKRLTDEKYLDELCEGMLSGIIEYITELAPKTSRSATTLGQNTFHPSQKISVMIP